MRKIRPSRSDFPMGGANPSPTTSTIKRLDKLKFEVLFLQCIACASAGKIGAKGGETMKEEKQDEKTAPNWEICDPKPPVIRSGRMENRRQKDIM